MSKWRKTVRAVFISEPLLYSILRQAEQFFFRTLLNEITFWGGERVLTEGNEGRERILQFLRVFFPTIKTYQP